MSQVIRSARLTDRSRIWELLNQFANSYVPSETHFDLALEQLVADPKARLLVIETDHGVVGYTLAFVLPTLFANGPILEILEVVIDESQRGIGLGTHLIEELLTGAWDSGCVEAVVPTRRAAPFYEKIGFVRTANYLKILKPT